MQVGTCTSDAYAEVTIAEYESFLTEKYFQKSF